MGISPRIQRLVERLREMRSFTADVEGWALVSADGLVIACDLPTGVEEDRVAAMSAAMLALGEHIGAELERGALEQVYVRGATGYILVMAAGQDAVLTLLARREAKLGLVLLEARRAAADLAAIT